LQFAATIVFACNNFAWGGGNICMPLLIAVLRSQVCALPSKQL